MSLTRFGNLNTSTDLNEIIFNPIATDNTLVAANATATAANATAVVVNSTNITTLNTSQGTQNTNIATNTTDITTLNTSQASQNTNIATNTTDITNINTVQGTQNTNIATNTTDITNINTVQGTQNTNIATNTTDITNINTVQGTQNTNIATNTTNITSNDTDITNINTALASKANLVAGKVPVGEMPDNVVFGSGAAVLDNLIVRYDGTTGKLLKGGLVTLNDAQELASLNKLTTAKIVCSNYYDGSDTAGINIFGATGIITLTGSSYTGQAGKILTTAANGQINLIDNNIGDVVGPSTSVDNTIPRHDGTTGKLLQTSGVIIDDSNNISNVLSLEAGVVSSLLYYNQTANAGILINPGTAGTIGLVSTSYSGNVDACLSLNAAGVLQKSAATLSTVGNLAVSQINTGIYGNGDNTSGFLLGNTTAGTARLTSSLYAGSTDAILKLNASGTLEKSAATLTTTGNLGCIQLTTPKVICPVYSNSDDTAGLVLAPTTAGTAKLTSSLYTGSTDAILKLNTDGTLEKSAATLTSAGLLTTGIVATPLLLANLHFNDTGNSGILMTTGAASDFTLNSTQYKGLPNALTNLNTSGLIQKTTATLTTAGDLACSKVAAASYNDITGVKGIDITNAAAANLQLTGSAYQGHGTKYLQLDGTGNVSPQLVSTNSTYVDFKIKQSGGAESNVSVYAQKLGDIITLHIPTFTVATADPDISFFTYLTNTTELFPIDKNYNSVTVSDESGFARFIYSSPNWYLEFKKYAGDWSLSNQVQAFTITYRSANSTQLTNTTWGIAYPIIGLPTWGIHSYASFTTLNYTSVAISTDRKYQLAVAGTTLYISDDYGVTFTARTMPTIAGGTYTGIATSTDGTHIYATKSIVADAIIKSTDYGATWSTLVSLNACNAICCSASGQIVLAGTVGAGIRRSTDYGATFVSYATGNPNYHDVCINDSGSRSYGVSYSGAPTTTGNITYWDGATYASVPITTLILRSRKSITCNRGNGDNVVAFGIGGIVEHTKTGLVGSSWALSQFPSAPETCISASSNTLGTVHIGVSAGGKLYKSSNMGVNFTEQTISADVLNSVALDGNGGHGIAGDNTHMFEYVLDSINPAVTVLTPLDNATGVLTGATLSVQFNETIAKGTGDIRIYKLDNTLIQTIAIAATTVASDTCTIPHTAFVGGESYYILIDAGAIVDASNNDFVGISSTTLWSFAVSSGPPPSATTYTALASQPSVGGDIYTTACSSDGAIVIIAGSTTTLQLSTNSGVSWTSKTLPLSNFINAYMSDNGQYHLLGGSNLIISINSGSSYSSLGTGAHAACMNSNASIILKAPSNSVISKSTNYGSSFTAVSNSPTVIWSSVCVSDNGLVIVGTVLGGLVYVSKDGGATAFFNPASLGGTGNYDNVYCSADGTKIIVFEKSASGSMWQSSDSGTTFTNLGVTAPWWRGNISSNGVQRVGTLGDSVRESYDSGASWPVATITSAPTGTRWRTSNISSDGSKGYLVYDTNQVFSN
jgi:hypothetical protein